MTIPMITQAPLGALGAAGMKSSLPGKGSTSKTPRFGMTMWFRVKVTDAPDGKNDLGLWSGCQGLGVSLDTDPVWSGGDYQAPYLTPNQITYPNVTLERAMSWESAKQVREWLETIAAKWIGGDEGGAAMASAKSGGATIGQQRQFHGCTVTISLFSSLATSPEHGVGDPHKIVAEWELRDAIPVSWTGPTLSSTGGGVAIEKLVLAHRGFLQSQAATGSKPNRLNSQSQGRFTLSYQGQSLEFQYNPREVTEERTTRIGSDTDGQTLTINGEEMVYDRKKLTLSELVVEGVTKVKEACDKLWNWTELDYSTTKKGDAKRVRVQLGSGTGGLVFDQEVMIKTARVSHKRFTAAGVPSRAVITLTLLVVEKASGQRQAGQRPRSATR